MKWIILFLTALVAVDSSAIDLRQIDATNQRRQQLQDKIRAERNLPDENIHYVISIAHSQLPVEESPCYSIKNIQLVDYDKPNTPSQYQSLLNEARHDLNLSLPYCLGTKGINILMKQLQNKFIEKGLITTRVVATQQNLRSGKLLLTIIPGRIRHILVTDKSKHTRFTRLTAATGFAMKSSDLLNLSVFLS